MNMAGNHKLETILRNIERKGIPALARERMPEFRTLVHLPSLRTEMTETLLFALRPEQAILFVTPRTEPLMDKEWFRTFGKNYGGWLPELEFIRIEKPGNGHSRESP